jgi:hypothetical protein
MIILIFIKKSALADALESCVAAMKFPYLSPYPEQAKNHIPVFRTEAGGLWLPFVHA